MVNVCDDKTVALLQATWPPTCAFVRGTLLRASRCLNLPRRSETEEEIEEDWDGSGGA